MANIKFSDFNTETNSANVDFVVGYQGTTMKKISPSNLSSVTSLNDLSDVIVNNTDANAYFIEIPASRSGDLGNLGIGVDALEDLTSGKYNVAIGADALNSLTTSQYATAIGYNAGAAAGTTLMGGATLIGHRAGFGRSGFRNVAVGDSPMSFGSGKTNVNKNTAIGYHTLYRIDTNGENNIAIGHETSQFLTTAVENIAIGDNTARNSTADGLLAIGHQAAYSNTSGVGSTIVGYQAGYTATTGGDNSFFGYHAGRYVTGNDNTAIGREAMEGTASATNEYFNVAVGYGSLTNCAGAFQCATLGHSAGNSITSGSNLTVLGYNAQPSSATATNEITLGNNSAALLRIPGLGSTDGHVLTYEAASGGIVLKAAGGGGASDLNGLSDCLVDGNSVYVAEVPSGLSGNPVDNTVLGIDAGAGLTTGFGNTFIGFEAAKLITDSDNMVVIGRQAANASASNGDRTVAIGYDAYGSSISTDNVAVGYAASQFSGVNFCVAIGRSAGVFNGGAQTVSIGPSTNYSNSRIGITSVGYEAGRSQTSGDYNTNIGWRAGYSNTTNGDRSCLGYESAYHNTGQQVDAFGYRALYGAAGSSTGSYNAAFGREAGVAVTSGSQNTCIGSSAGKVISTGSNNTVVGSFAGFNTIATGDNNILIGQNAASSTSSVSNEVNLFNGSVVARFQGAAAAWSFVSDARDKKDVEDLELGLDFVTKLKPRKFKWDLRDSEVDKNKEASGFIAQEVIEVLDEVNADYTGIVNTNNPEQYTVSQANIIPMLVNSIKELKQEIEQLKKS